MRTVRSSEARGEEPCLHWVEANEQEKPVHRWSFNQAGVPPDGCVDWPTTGVNNVIGVVSFRNEAGKAGGSRLMGS